MSLVRVAHIDCTTTGASPPTAIPPMSIFRVLRGADWSMMMSSLCLGIMLMRLFGGVQRDYAMTERRPRPHRHRHKNRLRDLLIRGAMLDRSFAVNVDTPGALRDMRGGDCHQLLHLAADRAILEHALIEVDKRLEHIGFELAQLAQAFGSVGGVKIGHLRNPLFCDGQAALIYQTAEAISNRSPVTAGQRHGFKPVQTG